MAITCCNGCVPPKRNPYCHGTCPEYLKEKAEYDQKKAEQDRERDARCGLLRQKYEKVFNAYKKRRNKKI